MKKIEIMFSLIFSLFMSKVAYEYFMTLLLICFKKKHTRKMKFIIREAVCFIPAVGKELVKKAFGDNYNKNNCRIQYSYKL